MNNVAIDIISDLNLETTDDFDWTGKPTSLFCIIAGGLSKNIEVIDRALEHLSKHYRGVLYIDGINDHEEVILAPMMVAEIKRICEKYTNVVYLHNHVIVLNGVAFVGCNGWWKQDKSEHTLDQIQAFDLYRMEDIAYLTNTLRNLQVHKDAKKVVVVSGTVPGEELLYRGIEEPIEKIDPLLSLIADTEHKVSAWIFGGSDITVDTVQEGRRFINNPCVNNQPYWPKRIEV